VPRGQQRHLRLGDRACRCQTARVLDALIIVTLSVAAAAAALDVTHRLKLSHGRAAAAIAAATLLVGVVASELAIDSVSDWWADHPSTGAVLTGVLLATLTVLVVEAAIARQLDDAAEKRWRSAGQAVAGALLDAAAGSIREQQYAIWKHSEWVMEPQGHTAVDMHAVTGFAAGLSGPVIAAAPILTATDKLHAIYEHALAATRAAAEYEANVQAFAQVYLPARPDADPHELSDDGVELWWLAIAGPWTELREHMQAFSREAHSQLAARPSAWDLEPWNLTSENEAYERRLQTEIASLQYDPELDA
jgi:hypothetical protein